MLLVAEGAQVIKPCQLSSTRLFYFAKNEFLSTCHLEQSVANTQETNKYKELAVR